MTQTTVPDNIPSPDLSDQYALTQDMANLADGVQRALVRRANLYTGTSADRTAFTTAPEGTHWQDTNGAKILYVRKSGVWVPSVVDSGDLPLPFVGGWTSPVATSIRRYNQEVRLSGSILNSGFTGGYTVVATIPSSIPAPVKNLVFPLASNSTTSTSLEVRTNREVAIWRSSASGAWWSLGNVSYWV